MEGCSRVGKNKAPGLDGNIALKKCIKEAPAFFLDVYRISLKQENFPRKWKPQRLLLLSKGEKAPEESYRPLYMLNTADKIFELIIHQKI